MMETKKADVIIIGAGAAGLICAIEAAKRGRKVIVLECNNKVGKKILMSGGGYCNFTNYHIDPDKYISHNPHFCKSALSRYTQWDFIDLLKRNHIPFHEKTLGQLFCDNKAKDIVNLLLAQCTQYQATILLNTAISRVEQQANGYLVNTNIGLFKSNSLVIASGGLSIPTMGASPFGYKIAAQFGIKVYPTRAGLVPLTLHVKDKAALATLSGIGTESIVSCNGTSFREAILFTHRGLSGPAILQISSYWQPGQLIEINLLPQFDLASLLKQEKRNNNPTLLKTILQQHLPKRLVSIFTDAADETLRLASMSDEHITKWGDLLNRCKILPNGTEGYRTAEVTLGGIDCDALSSKTLEVRKISGLYFIGEVIDVTGWLGGYNFQWAWSSGWAAGQVC